VAKAPLGECSASKPPVVAEATMLVSPIEAVPKTTALAIAPLGGIRPVWQ
jgi:hypothetical protein